MKHELIAAVTAHTGRVVEAFLSDNAIDPDIAVEIFILRPRELGTEGLSIAPSAPHEV